MLGIAAVVECEAAEPMSAAILAAANINPSTRLATDYLNHFNNVIMLFELIAAMPECACEIIEWTPVGYEAYFSQSRFRHRDLAITAFQTADPVVRSGFLSVVAQLNAAMAKAQALLAGQSAADPECAYRLRCIVKDELQPLIAEASGVINGKILVVPDVVDAPTTSAQDSIDELFG